jgi:hypothetical protein
VLKNASTSLRNLAVASSTCPVAASTVWAEPRACVTPIASLPQKAAKTSRRPVVVKRDGRFA